MSDSIKDLCKKYEDNVGEPRARSVGLSTIPEYPEIEAERGMWSTALDAIWTTLRFLAPATLLTLLWGQQGFVLRILKYIDSAFRALLFSSEEQKQAAIQWLSECGPVRVEELGTVWRHGWIVCGALDAALPGACAGHPPTSLSLRHAQTIAEHYLGVKPVFSHQELEANEYLSKHLEWRLTQYINSIRQALLKVTAPVTKPSPQQTSPDTSQYIFDYVARGSGFENRFKSASSTYGTAGKHESAEGDQNPRNYTKSTSHETINCDVNILRESTHEDKRDSTFNRRMVESAPYYNEEECKIITVRDDEKESTYISLSDIDIEIVENKSEKSLESSPERDIEIAQTDYKSRFKIARQYFQSLEELREVKKQHKMNECEQLLYNKSTESLIEDNQSKRLKKKIKSHTMPSSQISEFWNQLQEQENETNESKPVKISEKFHVEDLFTDVMDGRFSRQGSLRGIPHKKAVLEAFRSMENISDSKLSPYELAVSQFSDFDSENKTKNAQTYLSEYPYLPTTDPSKYHSRLDVNASGLISFKELLNRKDRRNSVPDLRLNPSFTVNL
ncbi:unnamed protein product, partial [Iphiclides podalirius]